MPLINRPLLAPAFSGQPVVRERATEHPIFMRSRRTAATEDAPAIREDVAYLRAQVAELVSREEERAAAIARIEEAVVSMLGDVAGMRARLDEQ